MKERAMITDIKQLQMKMESLKDSHQEHRSNIKQEAQSVLQLNQFVEEKQKMLDMVKEKCDDENQIKNVLMMRIKGKLSLIFTNF